MRDTRRPIIASAHRCLPLARLLAAVAVASTLAACDSPQKLVDSAQSAYARGQYQKALAEADAARQSATDDAALRAEAAYVAGMSAYRLDDLPGAEQRLELATASTDPQVAGRAYAQLGSIRRGQRRYREAADDFNAAAIRLEGDEAAKARHEAMVASRAAGDPRAFAATSATAVGRAPTAAAAPALPTAAWTLQGGCFRDRTNAERIASTLSSASTARGLGPARVVAVNESHGPLYCVMIGQFATRQGAEDAKVRLGRPDVFARTMPG